MIKITFSPRLGCVLMIMGLFAGLTVYGQHSNEEKIIADYVSKSLFRIHLNSSLYPKKITAFSYFILFNERGKVDSVVFSSLPDCIPSKERLQEVIRQKFNELPSEGISLANGAVYVPVQMIPMEVNYQIDLTTPDSKSGDEARAAWEQMFPKVNSGIMRNRQLNYIMPITIELFPSIPSKPLTPGNIGN